MKPGTKHTDEARARISEARKGKKHSDEARAKMREAARARWERKRGERQ